MILRDLAEASPDVAANFLPFDLGETLRKLRAPARTTRGDDGRNFDVFPNHQNVSRILSREKAGEGKTGGHIGGHVLGAMYGEVGPARQKGGFQLLGEEALAAFLLERPFQLPITRRGKRKQLDLCAHACLESFCSQLRLLHGKRTFSRG